MKALCSAVSGGTGYVGRFVVEGFLAAGHRVVVLGRTPPAAGFFSAPVEHRPFSLDPQAVEAVLLAGVDVLVHAAFDHLPGKYRGGEGDEPERFRCRNLDGTVALFKAARAAGVRHVVFLSSRAVYGPRPPGTWLDEQDEPRPDTLYGEVKLAAERALCAMSGGDFHGVSLRVTGVYGPAGPGRAHKWAALFSDYLAGRGIAPRAGTEVHGRDVAQAIRRVLDGQVRAGAVLNVSDVLVDRRDILAIVKQVTGAPYPLPRPANKAAVNAMRCDRLAALGWRPGGMALLEETVAQLAASREDLAR